MMRRAGLFCFLGKVVTILPPLVVLKIAGHFGWIGYHIHKRERELMLRNITRCFPAQSSSVHKRLALRAFQHIILTAVDSLRFGEDSVTRRPLVNLKNYDRIAAALSRGQGVILITAHYGNLGILPFALKGICRDPAYLLHQPTKRISWLIAQFRQYKDSSLRPKTGFHQIESSVAGLTRAGHLLKQGNAVIMAADLTWTSAVIPLSFLGVPYFMSRVPASISLRTNAALLPIITKRNPDGSYDVIAEEPITNRGAISKPAAEHIMTREFAELLEEHVLKCPEQWNWTHSHSWSASELLHNVAELPHPP